MPAAHHDHGFWYAVRLLHLGPADFLRVQCRACGVWQTVAPWQMHHCFHPDTLVPMITDQVRCRGCGQIGPKFWVTWRAHPGPEVGPPDPEAVRRWFKDYENR